MPALVLGAVIFRNFEIPDHIVFPVSQRHKVHYFVGSDRVIDAMGPDPEPIRWNGRFTGPNAASRVRTLQAMTSSGAEWACVYNTFMERVLIIRFTPIMTKAYDYDYAIELLPTTNQGGGAGGLGFAPTATTGEVVGQDLSQAQSSATTAQAIQDALEQLLSP